MPGEMTLSVLLIIEYSLPGIVPGTVSMYLVFEYSNELESE